MPDFLFQRKMWLVLLIRTSGECIQINLLLLSNGFFFEFFLCCPILGRYAQMGFNHGRPLLVTLEAYNLSVYGDHHILNGGAKKLPLKNMAILTVERAII